jgi:hypothetical protein
MEEFMKAILLTLLAMGPIFAQSDTGVPTRLVVTVEPKGAHAQISPADVMVYQNHQRVAVTEFKALGPDRDGLQLWILIDDGDEQVLSNQFNDLKTFIARQPAAEEIGIGYLQNGSVKVAQDLTTDHQAAQNAIRMPLGIPGISASPYLAVVSLIKKWPESAHPREIVMITSGIDPDYGSGPDNLYLDQAAEAALRARVIVHAIWFHSAGHVGHSFALLNWGQLYLSQLTEQTGGEFFWEGTMNPVSFMPYLNRLDQELSEQRWLTFSAKPPAKASFENLRIGTEVPGNSIVGPSRVWIDPNASRRQSG